MKRSKQILVLTFAASTLILMSMSAAYAATNKLVIAYTIKPPNVPAQGTSIRTEASQACTNLASVVGVPASYILRCKVVHDRLLDGVQAGAFPASLSSSGMLQKISFWYYTVSAANLINVSTIITNYNASPKFRYTAAEPDFMYSMPAKNLQTVTANGVVAGTCGGPSDPLFCEFQWALDNHGQSGGTVNADINLLGAPGGPGAWDRSQGAGIVVAILDTGVDYNHPDLAANIWTNDDPAGDIPDSCNRVLSPTIALADDDCNGYTDDVRGWNFVSNNNNPMDTYGSGTHAAGIIAAVANNGIGIAGIAPLAKIMPIKVATTNTTAPVDSIVSQAVAYAILNGADVILMNFSIKDSNYYYCGQSQQCTTTELKYGYDNGVVLVAPVGTFPANPTFPNLPMWPRFPAAFGSPYRPQDTLDVLGVGATNRFDARGANSNYSVTESSYGGYWAEIAASGTDVVSTTPGNQYAVEISNPAGAPHVAGVAALMKGVNRGINHDQVKQKLLQTKRSFLAPPALATNCPTSPVPCNASQPQYIGAGVIDATAAVNAVPSPNVPPVWIYPDPAHPTISAEVMMNGAFGFGLTASDPEGGPVTIRAVTIPQGSEIISWTWEGQVYYVFDWASAVIGDHTLTFAASDGVSPEVNLTVQIHVEPYNHAPVFGPLPTDGNIYFDSNTILFCGPANGDTIILRGGQTYSFQFNATDTNNFGVCIDDLIFFDPIGTINGANTTCSGYLGFDGWVDYPHNGPGPFNYTWQAPANIPSGGQRSFHLRFIALDEKLAAFDDLGNSSQSVTVSDDFDIYVNDPPVFVNPPLTATGTVGGPAVTFTLNAMDPNGNTPSVYMTNTLPGASFNSATRTFTMSTAVAGTFVANFKTLDGCETWYSPYPNSYTTTLSVTIVISPVTETVKPTVSIERPVSSCYTEPPPVDFRATLNDNVGLQSYTLRLYRRSGDTTDLTYGSGTLLNTVTSPSLGGVLSYVATWPSSLRGIGYYRYDIEVVDTSSNFERASKTFKVAATCIG